jgi:hypothetical protein
MYAIREFACTGCGAPVSRRAKADSKIRCITCAVARSAENAHQQRAKSGEFYERWAAGMVKAAREAEQLAAIGHEINSIF